MAIKRSCLQCSKEFMKAECRIRTGRGKFCSRPCNDKWKIGKVDGSNNPSWKGGGIKKECLECNKPFTTAIARTKSGRGKYCSQKCYWKFMDNGISTENEKFRRNRDYALWRTAVFMRDDYTCQTCGDRGGTLHADHIKPFALYPDLRLAIDNGRTLCIECHKQTSTYGRHYA